jgi:hypothetical protein
MQSTKEVSVVIGVLADDNHRRKTVGALRDAGFSGREIGAASDTGELVVQEDALARADVADHGLFDVLVGMGAPEREARRFTREFEAQRTIVTVQTTDRPNEAAAILRHHAATSVRHW